MRKNSFLKLIKKIVLLLIPIIVFIISYFVKDPLKVINKYNNFTDSRVKLNTGYVAWQIYLNNKDSIDYNSFIFSNSCGMAYPTKVWSKYINNCIPINLNANNESLYAINKKLIKLDENNENIDNVLIAWDTGTFEKVTPSNVHTYILHRDISNLPLYKFHFKIIKSLFKPKIIVSFIDYFFFNKVRKYMRGIITKKKDSRNNITNDIVNPRERKIKRDSVGYWKKHKRQFSKQFVDTYFHKSIYGEQIKLLKQIKEIFDKHNTNYRIVINPNYRLKKFDSSDLAELEKIFGKDYVFDFSGKNETTNHKEYYYDKCHYRPLLGDKLLQIMYGTNSNSLN